MEDDIITPKNWLWALLALAAFVGLWLFYIYGLRPVGLRAERLAIVNSQQYHASRSEKLYGLQLEWEDLERQRLAGGPAHLAAQQAAIIRQMKAAVRELPEPPADITQFLRSK